MEKKIYGEDEKIPGESAYDRCSYVGCKNGKYRNNRKLFLFPRHTDAERLEKWLQICGNTELRKKAYSSIRRSGLCGDHFDPSCFSDKTRYFLKRNSVPLPNYPPNLAKKSESSKKPVINDCSNEMLSKGFKIEILNNDNLLENNEIRGVSEIFIKDEMGVICDLNNQDQVENNGDTNLGNNPTRVPGLFEDYGESMDEMVLPENRNDEIHIMEGNLMDNFIHEDTIQSDDLTQKTYLSDNENDLEWNESSLNSTDCLSENGVEVINDNPLILNLLNNKLSIIPGIIDSIISTPDKDSNKLNTIVKTSVSTTELLRRLNADDIKDRKIMKLKKQNDLLKKEVKRLKQIERRRQLKNIDKMVNNMDKMTVNEQKNMLLTLIHHMDLPSNVKASILLQLC